MKILISISAIPLPLVIKHVLPALKGWDRTRYKDIFDRYSKVPNKYRIYIPLGGEASSKRIVVPQAVDQKIQSKGYIVEDYVAGLAVKADDPKKKIKIGKLISDDFSIKREYDGDPQRTGCKGVKQWVVISRHPYDIMGMSFDRGWKSCMHLTQGSNKEYLEQDVKHGTLVAYLINDNDRNINKPIARVCIKPYHHKDGDIKMLIGPTKTVYGSAPAQFYSTVLKFCNKINKGKAEGQYIVNKHLYSHEIPPAHYNFTEANFEKQLTTLSFNDIWKIFEDCNVDKNLFKIIVESKFWKDSVLRVIVAKNLNVPQEILQLCANDDNYKVRGAAAQNSNCTPEMLYNFIKYDDNRSVKYGVLINPMASARVLFEGLKVKSDMLNYLIAKHNNSTVPILQECYDSNAENVQENVLHNPRVSESILLQAASSNSMNCKFWAMQSSRATPAVLEYALCPIVDDSNQKITNEDVAIEAIKNSKIDALLLHRFALSNSRNVRLSVARFPRTLPETLALLSRDADEWVRDAAKQSSTLYQSKI